MSGQVSQVESGGESDLGDFLLNMVYYHDVTKFSAILLWSARVKILVARFRWAGKTAMTKEADRK